MKTINIKSESIKVEPKVFKTEWTIEYGEPEIYTHPDVQKRYDEFNDWLANFLMIHGINPMKHEEFIKDIIMLHIWDMDTDENRKKLGETILNHPDVRKDIRRQKIKKINDSKNSK